MSSSDRDQRLINYDLDEISRDGVLIPGGMLILLTFYLSRFLLFGPLSLLAGKGGRGSKISNLDMSFLNVDSPFEMATSIPAVTILFIIWTRNQNSADWVRWIWRNGRLFLLFSVCSQLTVEAANFYLLGKFDGVDLVYGIININVALYLLTKQRVRDVFSMFPEPEKSG